MSKYLTLLAALATALALLGCGEKKKEPTTPSDAVKQAEKTGEELKKSTGG
jgi:hypothetical protein